MKFEKIIGIRYIEDKEIFAFYATNFLSRFLCRMGVKQGEFSEISKNVFTLKKYENGYKKN